MKLEAVLEFLGDAVLEVRGPRTLDVTGVAGLGEAGPSDLSFCWKESGAGWVERSQAGVILVMPCHASLDTTATLVVVERPRLAFVQVMHQFFTVGRPAPGVHPTAVVAPFTRLGEGVTIGPLAVVQALAVGEGTVIHGGVHIYDAGVRVGRDVVIHAGCIVGVDGFGYEREASGRLVQFPSRGGVVLGDGVHLHAQVSVDRGTLTDTVVGPGCKIDKFCQIGHNVVLARDTMIAAHTTLGGGVSIGEESWLGLCVGVRDGVRLGNRVHVQMGAIVSQDVPDDATVLGANRQLLGKVKER